MVVLWPLACEFLKEVWVPHCKATGKPNQLVANLVHYATQDWRMVGIRAAALIYGDVISVQFFELVYTDNQLQMGVMARKLNANLECLLGEQGSKVLLTRIQQQQPLVSAEQFTFLKDGAHSEYGAHAYNISANAARKPTTTAGDNEVALAARYCVRWICAAGRRYFRDHLEGGRFSPSSTDDSMKKLMRLVPAHNSLAESAFAVADSQFKKKSSHMATSTASLHTMSALNNPLIWWLGLSDDEQRLHGANAKDKRKQSLVLLKDKQDSAASTMARSNRVEANRVKDANRTQKRLSDTAAALQTTLMQSAEEARAMIGAEKTKKGKLAVLIPQLKAYKIRLQLLVAHAGETPKNPVSGKALWTFSGLDVAEVLDNLCRLMTLVAGEDLSTAQPLPTLLARDPRVAKKLTDVGHELLPSSSLEKRELGWRQQAARVKTIHTNQARGTGTGAAVVETCVAEVSTDIA